MNDQNQAAGDRKAMGIFGTLIAGALMGAAAIIFSDKDKRNKFKKTIQKFLEMGEKKIEQIKDKVKDFKHEGTKRLEKELEKTKQKMKEQ